MHCRFAGCTVTDTLTSTDTLTFSGGIASAALCHSPAFPLASSAPDAQALRVRFHPGVWETTACFPTSPSSLVLPNHPNERTWLHIASTERALLAIVSSCRTTHALLSAVPSNRAQPTYAALGEIMSSTTSVAEALEYDAKSVLYSLGWSYRNDQPPRLAVGTFIEEYNNTVQILQQNSDSLDFLSSFDHPYPTTKVAWIPDVNATHPDLIATSGDFLRLWQVHPEGSPRMKCQLNSNRQSEFCAPLTAFDWNQENPALLGTSSIDTTCTVWDVETQQAKTQLIAHDSEVYDFAFAARGVDVFASVGADGSVRLFDLRALEHSTIIYESRDMTPLLRLRWNTRNPNYLATIPLDSPNVIVVDIRHPSLPLATLDHRSSTSDNCVNAISWAPHTAVQLASGGDGCLALIWNISNTPKRIEDPAFSYGAGDAINNLQWAPTDSEWVAITVRDTVRVLRV